MGMQYDAGVSNRKGGRPKKRHTDRSLANVAWLDRHRFPLMADALTSEEMRGWSQSAATKPIAEGGLGPRGAVTGRPSKASKKLIVERSK
jgi:hypothetical protein